MKNAIARLKASKAKYDAEQHKDAESAGRRWASEHADYEDVLRVVRLAEKPELDHGWRTNDGYLAGILMEAMGRDIENHVEAVGLRDVEDWTDDYVYNFLQGVNAFFDEIKKEL